MRQPARRTAALRSLCLLLVLASGPALAERFRVPGTGITIDAPPDFVLSGSFPGVEHAPSMSSILINELPAPIDSMTTGFTAENLATRGMTLNSTEAVILGERSATLYKLTQTASGIAFEKWLAATGDAASSVLIVATFPREMSAALSGPMRTAVLSTRFEEKAPGGAASPVDRFEGLRYRITPPAGLEIQHRVQNMLLLGAPGSERDPGPSQPIAVVGSSHSPVTIDDVGAFARERITRTAQIAAVSDIEGAERRVDGRPAYEIVARASDKDTGAPLAVYQMVVVDGSDYFITQGLVGQVGAAEYIPRFRAIAESMTIR